MGEPAEVIHGLLETFCRQADANLLPEIYVVAGDDIWLLNQEDARSTREARLLPRPLQGAASRLAYRSLYGRVLMMTLTLFRGSLWYGTINSVG